MPKNLNFSHMSLIGGVFDPPYKCADGSLVKNFRDLPPDEVKALNGTTIVNANFYHHEPNGDPWPEGMEGVRFQECVLTNCVLPPNCFLLGCDLFAIAAFSHDAEVPEQYWLVKEDGTPVVPLDEDLFARNEWAVDAATLQARDVDGNLAPAAEVMAARAVVAETTVLKRG